MYQEQIEKNPYSKKDIQKLRKLSKELEKARESPSVQAYIKKVKAELKA